METIHKRIADNIQIVCLNLFFSLQIIDGEVWCTTLILDNRMISIVKKLQNATIRNADICSNPLGVWKMSSSLKRGKVEDI